MPRKAIFQWSTGMKIGRNDPCPCGSGRKYKKCCLAADAAKIPTVIEPPPPKRAPQQAAVPASPQSGPEPKPVDPEQAAIDQALKRRYEQFEAADLDGKVSIYLSLVEGQGDPPMDEQDAVEMLPTLYDGLAENNQRQRFDELVAALKQKQPGAYGGAKGLCLELGIDNLVAQGRWDEVAEPAKELAALAGRYIDTFRGVMDMLDFHGKLPLLLEGSRIAWPKVKESDDIVSWGIDGFATRASIYELYDYFEHHPDASGREDELLQRLRPYADEEPTWAANYLKHLTRILPEPTSLKLADFDLRLCKPQRRRHHDDDEDDSAPEEDQPGPQHALVELSTTFLGWMRKARNVPLTRGEVGRKEMVEFLSDRAEGSLDDRRSMAQRMMQPDRKLPKRPIEHPLVPDRDRFEAYLAKLLGMLSWRIYDAAALMYITPLWLEFLELHGLLTTDQRQKAMKSLSDLLEPMKGLMSHRGKDPALVEALNTWPT